MLMTYKGRPQVPIRIRQNLFRPAFGYASPSPINIAIDNPMQNGWYTTDDMFTYGGAIVDVNENGAGGAKAAYERAKAGMVLYEDGSSLQHQQESWISEVARAIGKSADWVWSRIPEATATYKDLMKTEPPPFPVTVTPKIPSSVLIIGGIAALALLMLVFKK